MDLRGIANAIAVAIHVLAAVVWVGGMFFAYLALRPALDEHSLLARAHLWMAVFRRFFAWVWASVVVLLVTGFFMIFNAFGGFRQTPMFVNLMMALGILMMLLFAYVFFLPYPRLRHSVEVNAEPEARGAMRQIRWVILVNLVLGLIVVFVAASGAFALYD
ncbi:MAG: CopD family protein [Gammaproteobacteria bacterium]|nr:CopD family protein [Gammaproteobacteria bacterium]MBU6510141.1 CopD family protein [Gammaproteobacteria bacterium]MDE1983896.1 CopD family protein [Gammaproteobacteria bacterium]MDE2108259.1 CopD family protein [Gammaproteobacteria bacterium]MDE2460659.1 CopD family protein [Gammaproteobacteria bacterium]